MRAAKVDNNQRAVVEALRAAVWTCEGCGLERPATAHTMRNKRCRGCSAKVVGKTNGSRYRGKRAKIAAEVKQAIAAGMTVKAYSESAGLNRTYLSSICTEFGIETRNPLVKQCARCGVSFRSSPSQRKTYCSPACFYESGGAKRAGDAAAMAKSKYGAKKDANHKEIFDVMRVFTAVHDLSNVGCGCPDGIAWVNGGWQFFDVKNPNTGYGRRGLNSRQKQWASDWRGGPVYLLYNVEDAKKFARGDLAGLGKFPDSTSPEAALADIGVIPVRGVIS